MSIADKLKNVAAHMMTGGFLSRMNYAKTLVDDDAKIAECLKKSRWPTASFSLFRLLELLDAQGVKLGK